MSHLLAKRGFDADKRPCVLFCTDVDQKRTFVVFIFAAANVRFETLPEEDHGPSVVNEPELADPEDYKADTDSQNAHLDSPEDVDANNATGDFAEAESHESSLADDLEIVSEDESDSEVSEEDFDANDTTKDFAEANSHESSLADDREVVSEADESVSDSQSEVPAEVVDANEAAKDFTEAESHNLSLTDDIEIVSGNNESVADSDSEISAEVLDANEATGESSSLADDLEVVSKDSESDDDSHSEASAEDVDANEDFAEVDSEEDESVADSQSESSEDAEEGDERACTEDDANTTGSSFETDLAEPEINAGNESEESFVILNESANISSSNSDDEIVNGQYLLLSIVVKKNENSWLNDQIFWVKKEHTSVYIVAMHTKVSF